MPTIRFTRPFSSGSRPTPDPFDKFLHSHGFYRKHTARDSTSLFRAVSEQVFDTQDHHKQVRKDCVNFMIKHRDQYEEVIQGNFDQYVRDMAKTETFGTLTELRAMGYLFKRNIKLYRPFELGVWFVRDDDYKEPALNIFYASHFDSVFEKSYIVDAAFCQSIVYEILYKKVFKLPDIEYSVETMLYSDINHEPSAHEYDNGDAYATHIVFEDGRQFQLDRPENTLCILKDPTRCHFHNKHFEEIQNDYARRYDKSILPDKYCSCVRQLLFDGITPFPYKVAKALDANIYRNVEFDSWNEARKASKYRNFFKVGEDCLVKLNDSDTELHACRINATKPSREAVGGVTYVVFIEKLGEKRSVPQSSLRPLCGTESDFAASHRSDQYAKSAYKKYHHIKYDSPSVSRVGCNKDVNDFPVDYDAICKSLDFESYINLSNFEFASNNQQELIAYPIYSQTNNMSSTNNSSGSNNGANGSKGMKNRGQNSQNQSNLSCESTDKPTSSMSKIDEDNSYAKNSHDTKQDSQPAMNQTGYYQDQNVDSMSANQSHMPNYYHQGVAPAVYYCPTPEYNEHNMYPSEMVIPNSVYAIPQPYHAPPMQPSMYAPVAANQSTPYPVHVGGWHTGYNPAVNPQGYVLSGPPHYAMPSVPTPIPFQLPFLTRDLLRSNGRINFNPMHAYAPNGDDLPMNDKTSLRFYYNLGVEYFKLLQNVHGTGQLMAMIDGEPCVTSSTYEQQPNEVEIQQNQMVADLQQLNFESNENVEIQSPTKSKSYNEFGYNRRGSSTKYKRNDNRVAGKHFQGSFQGPTSKSYPKTNQKYNNLSGNSYDATPIKDNGGKSHQQRDQSNDVDITGGNCRFGSNVPPFPYRNDPNEPAHYGPPGNAYVRTTPPVGRPASVPIVPVQYHHQMHSNYWMPPSGPHQVQQAQPPQHHLQQQQSQSHSLNTSSASNPSQ